MFETSKRLNEEDVIATMRDHGLKEMINANEDRIVSEVSAT